MSTKKSITLICESSTRAAYANALSERLGMPVVQDPECDYALVVTDDHLEFRSLRDKLAPIWVNFLSPELNYRRSKGGAAKEMIARAVGIKGSKRPSVLDATAGLGKDSFVIASLGCDVHCLERSPIVAVLLEDGLARFFEQEQDAKLSLALTQIDAISYLKALPKEKCSDVIYLDPMFPEKKKAALPRKEMRIFREILGGDEDAEILLQLAIKYAKNRVVVKRPRLAETIGDLKPDIVFEGKSSRFDVYLT